MVRHTHEISSHFARSHQRAHSHTASLRFIGEVVWGQNRIEAKEQLRRQRRHIASETRHTLSLWQGSDEATRRCTDDKHEAFAPKGGGRGEHFSGSICASTDHLPHDVCQGDILVVSAGVGDAHLRSVWRFRCTGMRPPPGSE